MSQQYIEKEVVTREINIPEEEIEEYRLAFDMVDKDGSGCINVKEFKKMLKNLGQKMTTEEVEELIHKYDTDKSGEIDFNEYISYMKKIKIREEVLEDDIVIRAFQSFDVDKDNVISIQEFRHILCDLGNSRFTHEECDEIFKRADLDNDGVLNYREFVAYWRNKK